MTNLLDCRYPAGLKYIRLLQLLFCELMAPLLVDWETAARFRRRRSRVMSNFLVVVVRAALFRISWWPIIRGRSQARMR